MGETFRRDEAKCVAAGSLLGFKGRCLSFVGWHIDNGALLLSVVITFVLFLEPAQEAFAHLLPPLLLLCGVGWPLNAMDGKHISSAFSSLSEDLFFFNTDTADE